MSGEQKGKSDITVVISNSSNYVVEFDLNAELVYRVAKEVE